METIDRSALVPYSQEQMFVLVTDIESYPRFLPWCSDARVLSRQDDEVTARIDFHVSGVSKSFTTRNRNHLHDEIRMHLVDGPFSELEGSWRFTQLGDDGCKIALQLQYDFSSRVTRLVVAPVFGHIANSLVDAFQKRAAEIYGRA